jgi:hypothetical protein
MTWLVWLVKSSNKYTKGGDEYLHMRVNEWQGYLTWHELISIYNFSYRVVLSMCEITDCFFLRRYIFILLAFCWFAILRCDVRRDTIDKIISQYINCLCRWYAVYVGYSIFHLASLKKFASWVYDWFTIMLFFG